MSEFMGFSKKTIKFYRDLEKNNKKEWFDANRSTFDQHVIQPAQDFVYAMGKRLKKLSRDINADPRTNGSGSIFRIYRDVRFSKDKTPYKTAMGILFWEGPGKKMDNPGFYFHLERSRLMLFAGMHTFSKAMLKQYRASVVHSKHGPGLTRAITKVFANGAYQLGGNHYKRVPSGFDPEHKNAELLKHNGLYAYFEIDKLPVELYAEEILEYCFERYRDMHPLYKWLQAMIKRI